MVGYMINTLSCRSIVQDAHPYGLRRWGQSCYAAYMAIPPYLGKCGKLRVSRVLLRAAYSTLSVTSSKGKSHYRSNGPTRVLHVMPCLAIS
jgi:hypothetical protein